MLLTTVAVTTIEMAPYYSALVLYRWRVEEYHKIFKSGIR